MTVLCKGMAAHPGLKTLDVSRNKITDVGMQALSQLLLNTVSVHTLICHPSTLSALKRVSQSAEDVAVSGILAQLNALVSAMHAHSANKSRFAAAGMCVPLRDEGVKIDASSSLPANPGVANIIGPDGCRALAAACHANRSLKILSVQIAGCDEPAILALLDALTHNTALEHLHLVVVAEGWVYLSDRTIDCISAMLEANITLRELNLILPRLLTHRMQSVLDSLRVNGGLSTFTIKFGDAVFDDRTAALPRLDRCVFRECLQLATNNSQVHDQEASKYAVSSSLVSDRADWLEVGRGHFGIAYSCKLNGSQTCVKLFRSQSADLIRGQINEFSLINELGPETIDTLRPYCAFPHAFGMDEGKGLMIFMPLMTMGSLDSQWGKLSAAACRGIIINSALAITKLHAVGVLHRDVAPRNVLLQPNPFPAHQDVFPILARLCDLGLACRQKWAWIPTGDLPLDAWPPEVVAAGKMTDYASDVWAFGKLLLQVLQQGFELAAPPLADALVRLQGVQPKLDFDALVEAVMRIDPSDTLDMVVFDQTSAAEAVAAFTSTSPIALAHHQGGLVVTAASSTYSGPQHSTSVRSDGYRHSRHVVAQATADPPVVSARASTYSQPHHRDAAPASTYSQPQHRDAAPASTYSQPQHRDAAPASTYSQPQHLDAAPASTYSQPQHSAVRSVEEVWLQWCRHTTIPKGNVVHKFVLDWCLRFQPTERPSMRMLTAFYNCVHSDISTLPDCLIMDDTLGDGPLSEGDWPMIVAVMKVFDNCRMVAWSSKDIGVAGAAALGAVVQVRFSF